MSLCLWVCMLVLFSACSQLIKVQPIVRNRNIFRCLFHQYFKLFAFQPNQSSCVCVFNIHQILIIFCINLLSMAWGCLLKDSTSFRDCLRLVCAFYRNWRTSRAKNSIELYKYAGKRGGKMEGRAKKTNIKLLYTKIISTQMDWKFNHSTLSWIKTFRFLLSLRHCTTALSLLMFFCCFFLFSRWLFIFQF